MKDDTTGKTSKDKTRTDWRRLRSMTDEEVHAAILADQDVKPTDEEFWHGAHLVIPESAGATPAQSDARFRRALLRLCHETKWLNAYQNAINQLRPIEAGTDFFRVSFVALQEAQLLRLIRILDKNKRAASFWYLYRSDRRLIDEAMRREGLDIAELCDVAEKLRDIRNRTFIHIDKKGVFDPARVYRDAGIKLERLSTIYSCLWRAMKALYRPLYGKEFESDDYQGSDIPILARLRDQAERDETW
jgi:hypothetical protein